ncbi:MAG: ABC transporter ATP-binding protein [Candidatus Sericytochromatia bacterium]
MLRLINLTKHYGEKVALDGLSLEVPGGGIFCMLGHNGAGKTTTVNLLLNFIRPTSGSIEFKGLELHEDPAAILAQVAYIPELVMLYPELDALENLGYFSRLAGKRYTRSELETHLQRAGLPADAFKRAVGRYSKGMRQKVGIAIALAKQASLLVLDEPTSGLDPQASWEFSQLLQDLAAQGVTIFMVTHDLFRVRELRAQVGILKHGKLQQLLDSESLSHQELETLYLQVAH